jgi:hypothetical protein
MAGRGEAGRHRKTGTAARAQADLICGQAVNFLAVVQAPHEIDLPQVN